MKNKRTKRINQRKQNKYIINYTQQNEDKKKNYNGSVESINTKTFVRTFKYQIGSYFQKFVKCPIY